MSLPSGRELIYYETGAEMGTAPGDSSSSRVVGVGVWERETSCDSRTALKLPPVGLVLHRLASSCPKNARA